MKRHNSIPNEADQQLRESGQKDNIITFNGQGRSGKTTQAERLATLDTDTYIYALCHSLRDNFKRNFYGRLARSDQQLQQEVIGIPSLPWLTADFHWRIKPLLLEGSIIVFDHYLGDYYADMLPNGTAENFQCFVKTNLAIPHFKHGIHFYLDIDYATYQERGKNRKGTEWFTVSSKALFEERCARYQELCDLEYLIRIDAAADENAVFEQIQSFLSQKS